MSAIGSLGEFLEVTASDGTVYTSDNTLDPMVTVQPTETFSLHITQIEVDEFGNIKFLAKPTKTVWPSTVKISVTPKADISGTGMSHTTQTGLRVVSSIHNDPEQWDGVNVITLEETQLYCQNLGGRLPIRADFTNSFYANNSLYLENSQLPQSIGYQLASWDSDRNSPASISLISEWRNLYNTYSPPNTGFSNGYWISEAYFTDYKQPFVVDIDTGSVITNSTDGGKSGVACLYD